MWGPHSHAALVWHLKGKLASVGVGGGACVSLQPLVAAQRLERACGVRAKWGEAVGSVGWKMVEMERMWGQGMREWAAVSCVNWRITGATFTGDAEALVKTMGRKGEVGGGLGV